MGENVVSGDSGRVMFMSAMLNDIDSWQGKLGMPT